MRTHIPSADLQLSITVDPSVALSEQSLTLLVSSACIGYSTVAHLTQFTPYAVDVVKSRIQNSPRVSSPISMSASSSKLTRSPRK